jgi:Holliday junction resolvase-like predicted endonuclease
MLTIEPTEVSCPRMRKEFLRNYCAEKELKTKGYDILGKRVRTKYGEVDILAKKDSDLVAVEVKQRRSLDSARSCISYKQRQRISNSLLCIIQIEINHLKIIV